MGSQERADAMTYTKEQIKDKYKGNSEEILKQLNGINKELTQDDLVINFNDKDDVSVNNHELTAESFQEDFNVIFENFCMKNKMHYLDLDSIDLEKDRETNVELITLENKIFKTNIIPLRIMHAKAMLYINVYTKNRDDFLTCLPSLFFYNTKTQLLTTNFLANTIKDIRNNNFDEQELVSFSQELRILPEIRPNLKVVNGGKE